MRIAIITDSNSGISQEEAKQLGIHVLPMPFMIDGKSYEEGVDLSQEEFYQRLEGGADISTSMPSPEKIINLWEDLLKNHDEILHIPMSSSLSGSCETAMMLAQDYEGRVFVVNNSRISITQKRATLDAMELVKSGLSAAQVREILEKTKYDASIYVMVDTLKYLKKGGRVTPTAAALGTLLRIKPILQIQGKKIDAFAKARTPKQGKAMILSAIAKDLETRFGGADGTGAYIGVAYNADESIVEEFCREIKEIYPNHELIMGKFSLSVAAHTGPGVIAMGCKKKVDARDYGND